MMWNEIRHFAQEASCLLFISYSILCYLYLNVTSITGFTVVVKEREKKG